MKRSLLVLFVSATTAATSVLAQAPAAAAPKDAATAVAPTPAPDLPPVSDLTAWLVSERIGPRGQGPRPTCSVFTAVSAFEAAFARCEGRGIRLSVEYANWAGNAATGRRDDGDFFHSILAGFEAFGAVPEDAWPYGSGFDPEHRPADELIARGKAFRDAWKPRITVRWIKRLGPPGLDAAQFELVRRALAAGTPVALGSSHSRLAVGYIADATAPGGGRIRTLDSGVGHVQEITAEFVQQRINDAFVVEPAMSGDGATVIDLRPRLGGAGWVPKSAKKGSAMMGSAALPSIRHLLRTACAALAVSRGENDQFHLVVRKIAPDQEAEWTVPARASLVRGLPLGLEVTGGDSVLIVGVRVAAGGGDEWILSPDTGGFFARATADVLRGKPTEVAIVEVQPTGSPSGG